MKSIYKYEIEVENHVQNIPVPSGAIFRKVGMQNGKMFLWMEVENDIDSKINLEYFSVIVFGTGWGIQRITGKVFEFLDTVFSENAEFVWHVYKVVTI